MENPDLDVLNLVYEALATGDFVTVMSYLSADVVAHVPGSSPVAGDYLGKEAVAGYVTTLAELSGGTLRFEPHAVIVTGRHGAGLVRDRAEREGKALDMNNVHVWHIVEGTLTEVWIYPGDQYAWDDFWS
ncbi:MAG TPA: nuclear transport factor 2 family protein [Acidimicrobiales bacterium]|nr:nuclear transport factor 2 family protein [Acidimicrobiales bacterium]